MDDVLRCALAPVLRDLRVTAGPMPLVRDHDWTGDDRYPGAMLCSRDGTGQGVSVDRHATPSDRISAVADQVQEWVVEELWRGDAPTNWPPCPHHRSTHPLAAATRADHATWTCPADGTAFAPVGSL